MSCCYEIGVGEARFIGFDVAIIWIKIVFVSYIDINKNIIRSSDWLVGCRYSWSHFKQNESIQILRHAIVTFDHVLQFPTYTGSDGDDNSSPMPCEHNKSDEIYNTEYVDLVEDDVDIDYMPNCPQHNVCAGQ